MSQRHPYPKLPWTRTDVALEAAGAAGLAALVAVAAMAYRVAPALAHRYDLAPRGVLCTLFYAALVASAWSPPGRGRAIALTPSNIGRQLRIDRRFMLSAKLEIIRCLALLEIGLLGSSGLHGAWWGRGLSVTVLAALPVALLLTLAAYFWHAYQAR